MSYLLNKTNTFSNQVKVKEMLKPLTTRNYNNAKSN